MKLFKVSPNPTEGFDVAGVSSGLVTIAGVPTEELATKIVTMINESLTTVEHHWQHIVGDIMDPLIENWDVHVPAGIARERGVGISLTINENLAQLVSWLKVWLGDAESMINDPANRARPDSHPFLEDVDGKARLNYGQIRKMVDFINQVPDDDLQMKPGATYRHADGGLYVLVAIDVDHKGEDGVWRPGVLYQPTMNGVGGDTRMKTTTTERWRERFVFAG